MDGKPDFAGTLGGNVVLVFVQVANLNVTTTTITTTHPQNPMPSMTGMAVADFDLDGKVDIATSSPLLFVFRSLGDGTFEMPHYRSAFNLPTYQPAAADFNGDGKPDVVVGNDRAPHGLLISINTSM